MIGYGFVTHPSLFSTLKGQTKKFFQRERERESCPLLIFYSIRIRSGHSATTVYIKNLLLIIT